MSNVFLILSKIFSVQASAFFVTIYVIIVSIHLKKSKIHAKKLKLLEFSISLLIDYISIVIIFTTIKSLVGLQRPICELQPGSFILPYPDIDKICNHSFPSAHSAFATLLAVSLWSKVNLIGKLLLVLLVAIIGASRIGLAMHYPADVIYGILLVVMIHYFCNKLTKPILKYLVEYLPQIFKEA